MANAVFSADVNVEPEFDQEFHNFMYGQAPVQMVLEDMWVLYREIQELKEELAELKRGNL